MIPLNFDIKQDFIENFLMNIKFKIQIFYMMIIQQINQTLKMNNEIN